VAAFAARLKDAVDVDAVQTDLAAVVQRALEPAHVWLWTNGPDNILANSAMAARQWPIVQVSCWSIDLIPDYLFPATNP
jgi:hypothetical protein